MQIPAFALAVGVLGIFKLTYSAIMQFITAYGYLGIFALMTLENASLPIPSEVVLPAIGFFVKSGQLNFVLALGAALLGNLVGIMIDYYIAYYLGKDFVYRHARTFHIKEPWIKSFEEWFARNGDFTVFISRMMPVVRGLISFPAGFALMPKGKFIAYSMLGTLIWDVVLIAFGYQVGVYVAAGNIAYTLALIAVFAIALYALYKLAAARTRK
ncbi:MAG: DedA family protein [Candidatus Micrarchaeia archaeon]